MKAFRLVIEFRLSYELLRKLRENFDLGFLFWKPKTLQILATHLLSPNLRGVSFCCSLSCRLSCQSIWKAIDSNLTRNSPVNQFNFNFLYSIVSFCTVQDKLTCSQPMSMLRFLHAYYCGRNYTDLLSILFPFISGVVSSPGPCPFYVPHGRGTRYFGSRITGRAHCSVEISSIWRAPCHTAL